MPLPSVEGIAPFEIPLPACASERREREGGRRRGRGERALSLDGDYLLPAGVAFVPLRV